MNGGNKDTPLLVAGYQTLEEKLMKEAVCFA